MVDRIQSSTVYPGPRQKAEEVGCLRISNSEGSLSTFRPRVARGTDHVVGHVLPCYLFEDCSTIAESARSLILLGSLLHTLVRRYVQSAERGAMRVFVILPSGSRDLLGRITKDACTSARLSSREFGSLEALNCSSHCGDDI